MTNIKTTKLECFFNEIKNYEMFLNSTTFFLSASIIEFKTAYTSYICGIFYVNTIKNITQIFIANNNK